MEIVFNVIYYIISFDRRIKGVNFMIIYCRFLLEILLESKERGKIIICDKNFYLGKIKILLIFKIYIMFLIVFWVNIYSFIKIGIKIVFIIIEYKKIIEYI